jgi:hypothetical protein
VWNCEMSVASVIGGLWKLEISFTEPVTSTLILSDMYVNKSTSVVLTKNLQSFESCLLILI